MNKGMGGVMMPKGGKSLFSVRTRVSLGCIMLLHCEYRKGDMEEKLAEVLELGFQVLEFNGRERGRRQFGFSRENSCRRVEEMGENGVLERFLHYYEGVAGNSEGVEGNANANSIRVQTEGYDEKLL